MEHYILNWFEIPALDFHRAKRFYETILGIEMQTENLAGIQIGYFPFHNGRPTGCITNDPNLSPSQEGILLYLNGDPDLSLILNKIEDAGGKVLVPKKPVSPEYGFYAVFIDSEGNKIGVQSAQ